MVYSFAEWADRVILQWKDADSTAPELAAAGTLPHSPRLRGPTLAVFTLLQTHFCFPQHARHGDAAPERPWFDNRSIYGMMATFHNNEVSEARLRAIYREVRHHPRASVYETNKIVNHDSEHGFPRMSDAKRLCQGLLNDVSSPISHAERLDARYAANYTPRFMSLKERDPGEDRVSQSFERGLLLHSTRYISQRCADM
jgi:hypothetical protein